MKLKKLVRMSGQSIRRNLKHLLLSAIGIVAGIAAFSFFLSLGVGVKKWVHSDNFLPLTKVEVIPPKKSLEKDPAKLKSPITDKVVEMIKSRKEVSQAYPKMKFAFPGLAHGGQSVFGHDIHIEFIGDGIDPNLVGEDESFSCGGAFEECLFKDWWALEQPQKTCNDDRDCPSGSLCVPKTKTCSECTSDGDCDSGKICDPNSRTCIPDLKCWPKDPFVKNQKGEVLKDEFDRPKKKHGKRDADCWEVSGRFQCDTRRERCTNYCRSHGECGPGYYCDRQLTHTCYRSVPAIVSRYIIELYNGSVAPGRGWTRIDENTIDQFLGMTFTARLGESVISGDKKKVESIRRRVQLIGVSDKAIPIGITVPLGYVKRWNKLFSRKDESGRSLEPHKFKQYTSVVVWVRDKSQVHKFTSFIKDQGFELEDNNAETVGLLITIVTILLTIVSAFIVLISAINISHTYYMLISERRWEIGVFRAVGGSRWDIRSMILSEAFLLGLVSGAIGLFAGFALSSIVDFINTRWVPYFPFKPDSYFDYTWWLCLLSIGFGVVFCLAGAFFPANQAARMEPAEALSVQK